MAIEPRAFPVNQRVRHFMFGLGAIKEIDEVYTVIDFDEGGQKKFLTRMVVLERSNVPAPEPPPKPSRAKKPRAKK